MTEQVMVALRDATVKTPDGALFRLRAGKTYANPLHPAVVAYPGDWRPLDIDLPAPVADTGAPTFDESQATALDELREELAAAEEIADAYAHELERLRLKLVEHGQPVDSGTERPQGWLVDLAGSIIDEWAVQGTKTSDVIVAYIPPDKMESAAVREWARGQGITVSDRGVLARSLVESYRARADG